MKTLLIVIGIASSLGIILFFSIWLRSHFFQMFVKAGDKCYFYDFDTDTKIVGDIIEIKENYIVVKYYKFIPNPNSKLHQEVEQVKVVAKKDIYPTLF